MLNFLTQKAAIKDPRMDQTQHVQPWPLTQDQNTLPTSQDTIQVKQQRVSPKNRKTNNLNG